MHPYLETVTLPHVFSCEECWRFLHVRSSDLPASERGSVHGVEQALSKSGWTVDGDGTALCPKHNDQSYVGAKEILRFLDDHTGRTSDGKL